MVSSIIKKIRVALQLVDGIWSVPLAFSAFWLIGVLLTSLDAATGVYDISFIQPLLLAVAIVIGASNAAIGGLYFSFRGLYRFIYGNKDREGNFINYSKIKWTKLEPWQQFVIALLVYFSYFSAVILVYLKLV